MKNSKITGRKVDILIVDNGKFYGRSLGEAISEHGLTTAYAGTFQEAMDFCGKTSPRSLVTELLDLRSNVDVNKYIGFFRKRYGKKFPIVAYTNHSEARAKELEKELNLPVLKKPHANDVLNYVMKELTGHSADARKLRKLTPAKPDARLIPIF